MREFKVDLSVPKRSTARDVFESRVQNALGSKKKESCQEVYSVMSGDAAPWRGSLSESNLHSKRQRK